MAKPKKTEYTIDECYLMMFSEYEDVVTAQEAAGMLRLPLKRVYRMFRAGEIKSLKVGKDVRTCKLWIIEYIQKYGFIRQEKFHHERQAAVTVFCQTPGGHGLLPDAEEPQADPGVPRSGRPALLQGLRAESSAGRRNARHDKSGQAQRRPPEICGDAEAGTGTNN